MLRLLVTLVFLSAPAFSQTISGYATITDGDTIQVANVRVRLAGMDAPERQQLCGTTPCGAAATAMLTTLINGDVVTCLLNGGRTYDRIAGTCSTARISDLGGAMVDVGYAMNEPRYVPDYTAQTQTARQSGIGMWASNVEAGWEWRARRQANLPHDSDCAIKGNISANGRIYHLPNSRYYDRTSISAGERWFCTVTQAQAAGWRAPR